MVSATVNSVTTNFTYRGDGLRDSRAVSGGATTTFTWDIAGGLPVVLDDGNQYLYGAGLTAQKQSGNWYYYLADGLGSTMAVVNASGTVQDSYTYDVYGTPTKTGSLGNEFDFAGQQTDGTGLQYLRARYYDPATGTFLSREPMAAQTVWDGNPIVYGAANPTRFTDPTGKFLVEEGLGGNCNSQICTMPWNRNVPNPPGRDLSWGDIEAGWESVAQYLGNPRNVGGLIEAAGTIGLGLCATGVFSEVGCTLAAAAFIAGAVFNTAWDSAELLGGSINECQWIWRMVSHFLPDEWVGGQFSIDPLVEDLCKPAAVAAAGAPLSLVGEKK